MRIAQRVFLVLAVALFNACSANDASREARSILVDEAGVAIGGYDVVAYFTVAEAQQGSAEYSAQWQDATWWFASAENRKAFLASPERYAPAYGGWCAYGMAEGYAAETDPVNGWTIHEGRLYLNWDAEVTADWRADKSGLLEKSEGYWPTVSEELDRGEATVYWHE